MVNVCAARALEKYFAINYIPIMYFCASQNMALPRNV